MLSFDLHAREGKQRITLQPAALIVAGWTGRDEAALHHHIEELAAIGVPRPSSVPVFYRNSFLNLTQSPVLEVLGPDTSGEVEPVIVSVDGQLCLTVGSDHTDRKAETQGIALSKQLCAKQLGRDLWPLDDVAGHWDQLKLRSFATIEGQADGLPGRHLIRHAPARRFDRALRLCPRAQRRDVLRNAWSDRRYPACDPLRDGA
jgi:hypothetical protein